MNFSAHCYSARSNMNAIDAANRCDSTFSGRRVLSFYAMVSGTQKGVLSGEAAAAPSTSERVLLEAQHVLTPPSYTAR